MDFEFSTSGRVLFGAGKRTELFAIAPQFGRRLFLVTGEQASRTDWARHRFEDSGFQVEAFSFSKEPTLSRVEEGRRLARQARVEMVIAIGGGSVIDGAKAIAALVTNPGDVLSYLEVIGAGKPLPEKPLPFIAIPTTAGTGAEVTRNAVILSPEREVKVSLRSALMLPAVAIVDPELTLGLPPALTAATGMDALTQLVEPFVSCRANPLVDALCREAIPRVARALPLAFHRGDDLEARTDMALGSLFGGLALANAGLGAVHGFAAPVGGMFAAPHGAVCAALLPGVVEVNYRALKERMPVGGESLRRFAELGPLLTGRPGTGAEDAIAHLRELTQEVQIPRLGTYGIKPEDVATLCDRAAQASSMKANPLVLTREELILILSAAL